MSTGVIAITISLLIALVSFIKVLFTNAKANKAILTLINIELDKLNKQLADATNQTKKDREEYEKANQTWASSPNNPDNYPKSKS